MPLCALDLQICKLLQALLKHLGASEQQGEPGNPKTFPQKQCVSFLTALLPHMPASGSTPNSRPPSLPAPPRRAYSLTTTPPLPRTAPCPLHCRTVLASPSSPAATTPPAAPRCTPNSRPFLRPPHTSTAPARPRTLSSQPAPVAAATSSATNLKTRKP